MVSRPSSNMSIVFEKNRDKDGFFNCKDCPRRYATKTAYVIHSRIQHKESGIQVEQLQELPRVKEEIAFNKIQYLQSKPTFWDCMVNIKYMYI